MAVKLPAWRDGHALPRFSLYANVINEQETSQFQLSDCFLLDSSHIFYHEEGCNMFRRNVDELPEYMVWHPRSSTFNANSAILYYTFAKYITEAYEFWGFHL
jgi:hypothetical protein